VACTFISNRLVFFTGCLHGFCGRRERGTDAGVVTSIKAIDRCGNSGDVRWAGAVEDEGGGEVFAVCGEGK
jgi:hypothetical protein